MSNEKNEARGEKLPKRKKLAAERRKEAQASIAKVMLRNYHCTPRKMRLIVDQIRGMEVISALNVLKFTFLPGINAISFQ